MMRARRGFRASRWRGRAMTGLVPKMRPPCRSRKSSAPPASPRYNRETESRRWPRNHRTARHRSSYPQPDRWLADATTRAKSAYHPTTTAIATAPPRLIRTCLAPLLSCPLYSSKPTESSLAIRYQHQDTINARSSLFSSFDWSRGGARGYRVSALRMDHHRPQGQTFRKRSCGVCRREARARGFALHRRAAPRAMGARHRSRRRSYHHAVHLYRNCRGSGISRREAGLCRC